MTAVEDLIELLVDLMAAAMEGRAHCLSLLEMWQMG
jgi:hypothetical protein